MLAFVLVEYIVLQIEVSNELMSHLRTQLELF